MSDVAEAAVALTAELVAIDSVNPGLVPVPPASTRSWGTYGPPRRGGLRHAGRGGRGTGARPSLVAVGPGSPDDPTVVLNGHLDTVGVAGMSAPFTPVRDGDRLSGRGAADMKGGVAAMVAAAEELVASRAPVRVVLALVADEEDASRGSEAVIAALPSLGIRPDVCLIAEPTDLTLARSLRGFAVVRVRFPAGPRTARSPSSASTRSASWRGSSWPSTRAPVAVRAGGGDLMVTVARGGDSPFVVPEWRRMPRRAADRPRRVRGDRAGRGTRPPASRSRRRRRAAGIPGGLGASTPRVRRPTWRPDWAERLGTSATFAAPYWMEAPLWQAVCPTLVCGPSGGGLHAADEWVDLRQVRAFAEALPGVLPRVGGRQTCPLTRVGCGATRRCWTPGCGSRRRRRPRSPSPATSTAATSSATSSPATCRSTPGWTP